MEKQDYVVVFEVQTGKYPNYNFSRTEVLWGDDPKIMEDAATGIVAGAVARAAQEDGTHLMCAADVYKTESTIDYTDPGEAENGVHAEDVMDLVDIWLP